MSSANTKRKPISEIENNELYNTPLIALESFYNQYPETIDYHQVFYDPCNGLGKISNFLKDLGKDVHTSDMIDYGCQDFVSNFFDVDELPDETECIIFNPPFTLTEKFVDHAHYLMKKSKKCTNILMFNRLTTIESNARAKKFNARDWNLMYMYQYGFRVSCSQGVEEKPTANAVAYAFFEFEKNHYLPPSIEWIVKESL